MISAPYNFVPLSSQVFLPDWHQQVSHDIPFMDGLSGELHYTLAAETPLLVGGRQTRANNDHPGEVRPFRLPDGNYAIPGSSMKGLLRSVMEIAAFGRMNKVDEVRPGLRDISSARSVYATRDLICHSSPVHLQEPGSQYGYDLADLLFGAINSQNQADALRGRVSCGIARAKGQPGPEPQPPTILNSPKPSYFPNYLTQPVDTHSWKLKKDQYVTYIRTSTSRAPTLRGFKRYPVRPLADAQVQELTDQQRGNRSVQVRLHTLPPQTRFEGRIVFHNLKPVELGALLWVLTWGGKTELRHSLGMGKPFGFGQVRIELQADRCRLIPNDPAEPEAALTPERIEQLMRAFVQTMTEQIPQWERSPQILNLLAMANPQSATKLPAGMELRYMRLDSSSRPPINEFQSAKKDKLVLADYAVATGALDASSFRPAQGKPCTPSQPHTASVSDSAPTTAPAKPVEPAFKETEEEWTNVVLTYNKGNRSLEATAAQQGTATAKQTDADKLLTMLPLEQLDKLKKKGDLKGAQATVTIKGNCYTLIRLAWPGTS
jgi:hypothetical protein